MSAEFQSILEVATEAALAAGSVLREYWGKLAANEDITEKGRAGDLVTAADKASEAVILDLLQRHFPTHAILAEESGRLGQNPDSNYLWAIDPLDGTTNYAHQYPVSAVSIGLLIDGVPQLGVIYNPFRDELFRATRGGGATLNRRPIRVSETNTLQRSLLVTGFAYDRRETADNNYAEFAAFTHLTQGVRRSGAAAIDLADVACGRCDGYWERGLSPWDVVAGIILVEEAGGQVSAYDGGPLAIDSGRVLATNASLHKAMSDVLLAVPQLDWKFALNDDNRLIAPRMKVDTE